MKKYLLIIGIALLLSSIVGYLKPKERYFYSRHNGSVEVSKYDYYSSKVPKFKSTDINFPLVILVFLTVLGGGLVVSSFPFKMNKLKSKVNNIDPDSYKIDNYSSTKKHHTEETVKPVSFEVHSNSPIIVQEVNPIISEKTNISGIGKTEVLAETDTPENHDWHVTFLYILGTSLVYAAIVSYTSKSEFGTIAGFMRSFFVMLIGSFIIGLIIASLTYLFTKKFKENVHKIIRITAFVLTILAAGGTLINFFDTKAYSNVIQTLPIVKVKEQPSLQIYNNEYYSIKYPRGSKISKGNVQGYQHQVIIESPSADPKDFLTMSIGIHRNKYGQDFDKQVFTDICLKNTKKVVAGYNLEGSWSTITYQQIGIHQTSKFRLTYSWNGKTAIENDYVINNNNYIAVIAFSTFYEDKVELQKEIISSLILK